MTLYIAEIKRQFRDKYNFVPSGGTDTEPNFDNIPDGEYPMEIEDKIDYVRIKDGSIHCCNDKSQKNANQFRDHLNISDILKEGHNRLQLLPHINTFPEYKAPLEIVRLTNRDISENYRDYEFWLFPSDLKAAFAYWVVAQNGNDTFIVDKPLEAFSKYIEPFFPEPKLPTKFSYEKLISIIDGDVFETIPEILYLGEMKSKHGFDDSIDLHALARNVFYCVLREQITIGYFDKKATKTSQK